jgi:hypothetical protein
MLSFRRGDARMGMQTEAGQRPRLRVDQVGKDEGLEHLAKIAWAHQVRNRTVATGAVGDPAWALRDRRTNAQGYGNGFQNSNEPSL